MYTNSYFPVTEADQVIWLSHYALRLLYRFHADKKLV